jgi:ERCC4-type nuclease
MEIICDDREARVYLAGIDLFDNFSSKRLTTGDFVICFNRGDISVPLVVVERKTWADLASSIKDGRIKNIDKLVAYREETGARVAYLIEGPAPRPGEEGRYGVPYKSMRAHLDHLLYRDNIIELYSTSATTSAMRLHEFASNLESIASQNVGEYNGCDAVKLAMKKIEKTPEQISDAIWCSFKGISALSSRAFRPYCIKDLYTGKLDRDSISNVIVRDKKFGNVKANKIMEQVEKDSTLITILCAVPQISTKRAEAILALTNKKSKREFFEEWDETEITKAVGKSCFEKLTKFLCQVN